MLMKRVLLCVAISISSVAVWADQSISRSHNAQSNKTQIKGSPSKPFNSKVDLSKAERWGLDRGEYQRYLTLMDGPLGKWNPELDPVMVLGMFAETEAERQRYAFMFAQQEHELVTRTLAFEQAYRVAFADQFPDAQVINRERMQPYYDRQAFKSRPSKFEALLHGLQPEDRLLFFVGEDCTRCSKYITQLHNILNNQTDVFVDVFLTGNVEPSAVRFWAQQYNVDIDLVQQGRLTLNVDQGTFETLKKQSQQSTPFYLSRNANVFAVEPTQVMRL